MIYKYYTINQNVFVIIEFHTELYHSYVIGFNFFINYLNILIEYKL